MLVAPGFSRCLRCAQTLDRSKQPPIGKVPELRVPTWTKAKLSNGAELIVSEKHDLPLVSFSITFLGGSDQFETAERRGVGSLTASMMSEGTKTRNGDDLSNALQLLGTNVSVGVGAESGSISFVSTTAQIRGDARHPRRHAGELDVSARGARTAARAAARRAESGEGAAGRDCRRACFRACSTATRTRSGSNPTEQTIKAITRADVVDFHQRYFKPGRALITVVGDVTPAAIRPVIEKGLAELGARRRAAGILVSAASGGEADDDLSGRQARRRAVDVRASACPARRAPRPTTSRCR